MPSLLLDDTETVRPADLDPARQLRTNMAAVRVSFTWFGTRKSLNADQKAQAAESFGAQGQYLSAGKKLLDSSHPAFKAVTAIRGRIVSHWKSISLPFPEPGLRLIRQADVASFDRQMTAFRTELDEAVDILNRHFDELRASARERLGSLYDPSDYPLTFRGLFGIMWDYPSVEPPEYLRRLSPKLYEQECQRVTSRFNEAVQLAEEAFVAELNRLVNHLAERLSGQEDGKPKVFRDSAVENLRDFFSRFQQLNIRSNGDLDQLVEQAQRILGGVEPQQLRDSENRRQQVASQLAGVQATLDGLMVDRPRRSIIRPSREQA
ncbi:hypothetical protein [Schlesneria sp. T3-172]|uniref:hypothetical protein n=1 Tax=Schlesneria sphaerica TaxID=3373610 RepID=UPI0037C8BFB5